MSDTASEQTQAKREANCFCGTIRKGLEEAAELFSPPESACNHFREARIEFLRGIRDIVDQRINRLSRNKSAGGTRIVVE
jgi:hypothetical protein